MDKKILERACVVFQLLGYGYFIFLLYKHFERWGIDFFWLSASAFNLTLAIAVPLITRWVLTGKLRFKPVISKSEED
jgi:hypothetical protein